MGFAVSDLVAMYAAALSTFLAIMKLVGFIRGYYRVEVSLATTGSTELGNEIYIYNLCDRPLTLVYWRLEWRSGLWPFQKVAKSLTPEFDMSAGRKIEEYSQLTLPFRDEYYFKTGTPELEGKRLYMTLYFAGKKFPKLVKVQ